MIYFFAFVSVALGAVAQFMLKIGVGRSAGLDGIRSYCRLLSDWWFVSGILAYGLSLLVWLYVLSRLELSKAYPLVSIGYVLTTLMAWIWLDEVLSWQKIVGIGLIIAGVFFITRA